MGDNLVKFIKEGKFGSLNPVVCLKIAFEKTKGYCDKRKANGDYETIARERDTTPEKAYKDDFQGKMAEFACHLTFPNLSEPDINVYAIKDKRFSQDLRGPNFTVSVKSFDVDSPYPPSGVFQTESPGGGDPMGEDYCFMVAVDMKNLRGQVLAVLPMSEVKANLKPLVHPRFRGKKKALYLADVPFVLKKLEEEGRMEKGKQFCFVGI